MPRGPELFRFTIAVKPTSWNTLACKNRWTYQKTRDFWKEATWYASRKVKPTKPIEGPLALTFEARWRGGRAHDCDNLFVKPIIDMLRMDGFFPDDDTRYIPEVILKGSTHEKEDSITVICERHQVV